MTSYACWLSHHEHLNKVANLNSVCLFRAEVIFLSGNAVSPWLQFPWLSINGSSLPTLPTHLYCSKVGMAN